MESTHSPEVVADLIAENRRLKALLDVVARDVGIPCIEVDRPWGLTPQEFALLGCVAKHSPAHNSQILRAIKVQSRRIHVEEKIIDVVLHRVRRKIAPMGFSIRTIQGEGRVLCEPGRAAVKQIMGLA